VLIRDLIKSASAFGVRFRLALLVVRVLQGVRARG